MHVHHSFIWSIYTCTCMWHTTGMFYVVVDGKEGWIPSDILRMSSRRSSISSSYSRPSRSRSVSPSPMQSRSPSPMDMSEFVSKFIDTAHVCCTQINNVYTCCFSTYPCMCNLWRPWEQGRTCNQHSRPVDSTCTCIYTIYHTDKSLAGMDPDSHNALSYVEHS